MNTQELLAQAGVDSDNRPTDTTVISDEVLAVLMDTIDADGEAFDTTDYPTMPQLVDTMNAHVEWLAHWREPAMMLWHDDGPRGWDALKFHQRNARLAQATDKAAMPWLWNAKGQRVDLSSTRSFNAARGRMLAEVELADSIGYEDGDQ